MKRALFFQHYNPHHILPEYIIYWLKELQPLFNYVVFISNSPIPTDKMPIIKKYTGCVIEREDKGFDFGAWKDGLLSQGWDVLAQFDSITLVNDTCFGPLFPMAEVYAKMEKSGADFWGLTNHPAMPVGMPGHYGAIAEHIQSHFMVFNKNVVTSKTFQKFWHSVQQYVDIKIVIQRYETQLTKFLLQSGFTYDVYFNVKAWPQKLAIPNTLHFNPYLLLANKVPVIKIKNFLVFRNAKYLKSIISQYSNYNTKLIDDYFSEVYLPNVSNTIVDKNLLIDNAKKQVKKEKVAAALCFYICEVDLFAEFTKLLTKSKLQFDIFLALSDVKIKHDVEQILYRNKLHKFLKNIVVVPKDEIYLSIWRSHFKDFFNYEMVGFFHSKKVKIFGLYVTNSWLYEIYYSLLSGLEKIAKTFKEEKKVGIVISEAPIIYKIHNWPNTSPHNKKFYNDIWNFLGCKKNINFNTINNLITPYGGMFWFRPNALYPVLTMNFSQNNLPMKNVSLEQIMETLPIYIAWSQGYDFRVAIHRNHLMNWFEYQSVKLKPVPKIVRLEKFLDNKIIIFFLTFVSLFLRLLQFLKNKS